MATGEQESIVGAGFDVFPTKRVQERRGLEKLGIGGAPAIVSAQNATDPDQVRQAGQKPPGVEAPASDHKVVAP
jgi:hypothetical protein